jgi:large subunit ribosomal protein L7/L12
MAFNVTVSPSQVRCSTITMEIDRVKISIPVDMAMSRPTLPLRSRKSNGQFASSRSPTDATVSLIAYGDRKIEVIKEVRAITGLGLKETVDLVDSAPRPVKEGVPWSEAKAIKAALENVGATVVVRPYSSRLNGQFAPLPTGGTHAD